MKKLLPALLFIAITINGYAQAPVVQWQKSLGGSGIDQGQCVRPTTDGGYIVAGYSNSTDGNITGNHGGNDSWVVKLDDTGGIQWQRSLGGSNGDEAYCVQQTLDGGYIVAGGTGSIDGDVTGFHGGSDCWIVKLNDTGTIQWQKCLGGTGAEVATSIEQTTDGGYIIAGASTSNDGQVSGNHGSEDYWVVKINDTGAIQWQKSLGGSGFDDAYSVQQTTDGGYVVAGFSTSSDGQVTGSHGNQDFWVVKLNDTGAIQWQKALGGSMSEIAFFVRQAFDGGYIVSGESYSNDGDVSGHHGSPTLSDYWIVKLNDTGAVQWQKSLGGSSNEAAYCIQLTADGGYIVGGGSQSNDGDASGNHGAEDVWTVKLNDTGAIQWQKSLGGSYGDLGNFIYPTPDGGYIVTGWSSSIDGDVSGNHGSIDYWVTKLTCGLSAGFISGDTAVCFGSHTTLTDTASGGAWSVTNSNATISGSVVTGAVAGTDTAIYNVTNTCGTATTSFPFTIILCPEEVSALSNINPITIIPNPTTGALSVTGINKARIRIYNTVGQQIKEANNTDNISINEFPAGLYFVRVFNEQGALIKQDKIIKE